MEVLNLQKVGTPRNVMGEWWFSLMISMIFVSNIFEEYELQYNLHNPKFNANRIPHQFKTTHPQFFLGLAPIFHYYSKSPVRTSIPHDNWCNWIQFAPISLHHQHHHLSRLTISPIEIIFISRTTSWHSPWGTQFTIKCLFSQGPHCSDEVAEREGNSIDMKRWHRVGKSETLIRITNLMANFLSSLLPHTIHSGHGNGINFWSFHVFHSLCSIVLMRREKVCANESSKSFDDCPWQFTTRQQCLAEIKSSASRTTVPWANRADYWKSLTR